MNDGYDESQCASQGWHWVTAGSTPGTSWVELAWPSAVTVGRIKIDTTACTANSCSSALGRTAAGGTIQWWNGSAWVTNGTVSGKTNDWEYVFTAPVSTTKVRVYGLHASPTCGQTSNPKVFEFQAFGC
jgi:hypothetical protein